MQVIYKTHWRNMHLQTQQHNKLELALRQQCSLLTFLTPTIDEQWFSSQCLTSKQLTDLANAIKLRGANVTEGYVAINLYLQLSWQVIYLLVASVEHLGCIPDLVNIKQRVTGSHIYGLANLNIMVQHDSFNNADLIELAANHLIDHQHAWNDNLPLQYRLNEGLLKRLQSDTFHAALIACWPEKSIEFIAKRFQPWQKLCGKHRFRDQNNTLTFMRKTCCLHYQLVAADYCANCPLNKKGTSAC